MELTQVHDLQQCSCSVAAYALMGAHSALCRAAHFFGHLHRMCTARGLSYSARSITDRMAYMQANWWMNTFEKARVWAEISETPSCYFAYHCPNSAFSDMQAEADMPKMDGVGLC